MARRSSPNGLSGRSTPSASDRSPAPPALPWRGLSAAPEGILDLAATRAALESEWGRKALAIGEGGSIPIVGELKRVLGMDTIMVGFALDDDRVHSPNEKFDLDALYSGTRTAAVLYERLSQLSST